MISNTGGINRYHKLVPSERPVLSLTLTSGCQNDIHSQQGTQLVPAFKSKVLTNLFGKRSINLVYLDSETNFPTTMTTIDNVRDIAGAI